MAQEQTMDQLIVKALELYLSKESFGNVEEVEFSKKHQNDMEKLFASC